MIFSSLVSCQLLLPAAPGEPERIYKRSIFECAKLPRSIKGRGEVLHQLTENSAPVLSQEDGRWKNPTLSAQLRNAALPLRPHRHRDLIELPTGGWEEHWGHGSPSV